MNLREIPTIESAGRLGRRPDPESALQDAYAAERVLAADPIGSMALGAALGSAELLRDRVFPSATQLADMQRAAAAAAYTYHSSCYNNYSGPCDSPCYGFPPHQMSSWYCATCDEQAADPVNNPAWNWHFVGMRGSLEYGDVEPDICSGRDAWKWSVEGSCGNCQEVSVFRCHDGYKRYTDGTMDYTICEGLISCDGQLNLCP